VNPCPAVDGGTYGCSAIKGNIVYLFVHWWHRSVITIPDCEIEFIRGSILGSGDDVKITRKEHHIELSGLPEKAPDELCTVIKLEF
jgi:hypothetical protein